jgi:hypothetical protein
VLLTNSNKMNDKILEILGVGKQQVMDILDLEVQLNKVVMIFIIKVV